MKKRLARTLTAASTAVVLTFASVIPAFAGYSDCPYKSSHGSHVVGGTVELYNEIIPDYSSHQWHFLSYYYCTNCGYAWDINDVYMPMTRAKGQN